MKAVVIVDGLNLHHALLNYGSEYTRPNLVALSKLLLGIDAKSIELFYFTSAPQHLGRKIMDEYVVFKRLLESSGVTVLEGRFQLSKSRCKICGNPRDVFKEKETDVALALKIVESARLGLVVKILIVSTDSDLAPAISLAKEINPELEISIAQTGAFLKRANYALVSQADRKIKLSRELLNKFQFHY